MISSIESIFKKKNWGGGEDLRKLTWIKWDSICLPKEDGRLGVRRVGAFTLSLLGKWCGRLMVDREGLWYRVLKAWYGEVGGCIREGDGYASVWWKMICRMREGVGEGVGRWFDENIRRVVGDGRNTFFWYDNWIGDVLLRFNFPRLFDLTVDKECKVEEMWRLGWGGDGRAWV